MSDIFKQSTNKFKQISTKVQQTTSGWKATNLFTESTTINMETQRVYFSPKITEITKPISTSTSKLTISKLLITNHANIIKESFGVNSERSPISVSKQPTNNIVSTSKTRATSKLTSTYLPESEYSPTKVSLFTLTALLGVIYGLAFILAVVWIVWLYVKRKSRLSLKRSQVDSREFCSINSAS